jgi:uncharacterized membrane protein YphA (DoxX/SURF4 family)
LGEVQYLEKYQSIWVFIVVASTITFCISTIPVSNAHVRYILNETEIQRGLSQSPVGQNYRSVATVVLLALLGIVAFQFIGQSLSLRPFAQRIEAKLLAADPLVPVILRISVGLFLLSSGLSGELFSPQAAFRPITLDILSLAQITIGFLLTVGFLTKIAALGVFALVISSFRLVGFDGLDYIVLAGAAFVLFFEGGLRTSLDAFTIARIGYLRQIGDSLARFKPYSMPVLRLSFGINLIWLALTEKLLVPQLTEIAVFKYHVPIFPELLTFVFFFGFFEAILGGHYLLGIFNRLVSLIYLGLLVSAIFLFGETVNHLPLFGVAIAFLIRGAGPYRMDIVLRKSDRQPG